MNTRTKPALPGQLFERQVVETLQLMGYSVSHNEMVAGTQIDIVARKQGTLEPSCLLVECGDYKAPVGVDMIKRKSSVLLGTDGHPELYRLLYVARNGFTADAKVFAQSNSRVILKSWDELNEQLIDFSPYMLSFRRGYEESTGMFREGLLHSQFIEPAARDASGTHESLTEYLRTWSTSGTNHLQFILGDYGSGKTSAVRHFTYRSLVERMEGESREGEPLPILINLREYRTTANLAQVIVNTMSLKHGVAIPSFAALERIASTGRIVFVLDGLDEMVTSENKANHTEIFAQLLALAAIDFKLIITCRTNFFSSQRELLEHLRRHSIEMTEGPTKKAFSVPLSKTAHVVEMCPWSEARVVLFVRAAAGNGADGGTKCDWNGA